MTKAIRDLIIFLIYDGGADCCQKCVHLNKPSCGRYVSPTDYSGECSDDYCIAGMVKYFEQQQENTALEKEIQHLICKTISEATGNPYDFQEGHCGSLGCDSCIYSGLPKQLMNKFEIKNRTANEVSE